MRLSPLFLLSLTACGGPVTATYTPPTVPVDPGATVPIEETVTQMEKEQGSKFLHEEQFKFTITFVVTLPSNVLGMATVKNTGDCDIELNSSWLDASKAVNQDDRNYRLRSLGGVVRHELGHCFGLGHDPGPEEVMYYMFRIDVHTLPEPISKFNSKVKKNRGE